MTRKKRNRPDQDGKFQSLYDKNRRQIFAEQEVCALCGMPVDKRLKFPHPMSATIDHIIPIAKGGHPAALDNMQLAHLICNQLKGSRLTLENNRKTAEKAEPVSNRILPHTINWTEYKGER